MKMAGVSKCCAAGGAAVVKAGACRCPAVTSSAAKNYFYCTAAEILNKAGARVAPHFFFCRIPSGQEREPCDSTGRVSKKKNLNASRPSEYPTQGGKCQNVYSTGYSRWDHRLQRQKLVLQIKRESVTYDVQAHNRGLFASYYCCERKVSGLVLILLLIVEFTSGAFNMPTSHRKWVWEREAHINWSTMTCPGSTRSELP